MAKSFKNIKTIYFSLIFIGAILIVFLVGSPASMDRDLKTEKPKAISSSLLSPIYEKNSASQVRPSRYDEYLLGKTTALSNLEKAGFALFENKGCIHCHNGKMLGEELYIGGRIVKSLRLSNEKINLAQHHTNVLLTKEDEEKIQYFLAAVRDSK